jgi:hypothetical protein
VRSHQDVTASFSFRLPFFSIISDEYENLDVTVLLQSRFLFLSR